MGADAFRHGEYATGPARAAPRYSLAKGKGHGRVRAAGGGRLDPAATAVLSREDVVAIRRWARTTGYGWPVRRQARHLRGRWPGVGASTLADVLTNASWPDASYDRARRLDPPPVPRWVLTCPAWALRALLVAWLVRLAWVDWPAGRDV